MNTKLILIEGNPGSGKTTTAGNLSKYLSEKGMEHVVYLEGDLHHPADFESVACFTEQEYSELLKKYSDDLSLLQSITVFKEGYYFIPYAKSKLEYKDSFPEALYVELEGYDVYKIPVERYGEVILNRWRHFSEEAEKQDKIYIFECAFLQNPINTFLARDDRPKSEIIDYFSQLANTIEKLNPLILYYYQDNVKETLDRVVNTRSKEWLDFVTWYWTGQEYGKNRGLKGYEGVVSYLQDKKQLDLDILKTIPIQHLLLDNSSYDWEQRLVEIHHYLENKLGETV
jgi:Cdc6-like AAA superfamily ATPase